MLLRAREESILLVTGVSLSNIDEQLRRLVSFSVA